MSSARVRLFSLLLPLGLTVGAAEASAATAPGASVSAPADAAAQSPKAKKNTGKKAKKKAKKNGKKKAKKNAKKGKRGAALCGPLACTEAQRGQVARIVDGVREANKSGRDAGRALQTSLAREIAKPTPSKKELARIRKELAKQRNTAEERMFDALLELHAALDAEQRRKLSAMIEAQGVRRVVLGGGRGEGRGRGPHKKGRAKQGKRPARAQGPEGPPARSFDQ